MTQKHVHVYYIPRTRPCVIGICNAYVAVCAFYKKKKKKRKEKKKDEDKKKKKEK